MSDKEQQLARENEELKKQVESYQKLNDQSSRFSTNSKRVVDDQGAYLGQWTLNMKKFSDSVGVALNDLADAADPTNLAAFENLDEQATKLQREFGTTKGSIDGFKQSIADAVPELIKMGITEEQALQNMAKVMESMGSSATLGTEAITELSAAADVARVDIGKLATNFRDVGVSIYDVGDQMKEVTDYARSVGVSVAGVSDKVVGNLGKMNLYNFDNGIKGLAKMAATSERMGISMEQVFTFADKIYDPEGAIEMAAGLQRLGVTASGLLDPLRAMDLAANDPEGLQKEIINVTKEFTKFNEANGKFEIMPGSKRRLREIAKEMGIPAEELASMSIKAADFDMKMKQIQFPSLATDDETKEMIAGMAQLKDGKAMINVKNEQTGEVQLKQVDQLTASDIESLKKTQEEDSMTIEEVAREQLSVSKQIELNTAGYIKTVEYGKATAEPLEKLYTSIMGAQVDVTRNLERQATTKDIRSGYQSLTQPIEDYMVGGIQGDTNRQREAERSFVKAAEDAEARVTASAQNFITTTMTDISNRFKEAYMQPQKVETKSEVTINVKLTGDENTRGINSTQLENGILEAFAKPEVSSVVSNQIAGGNQPSATTGSKNK